MRLFYCSFQQSMLRTATFTSQKQLIFPLPNKLSVKISFLFILVNVTVAGEDFAALFMTLKRTKPLLDTGYWTFVRFIQLRCY